MLDIPSLPLPDFQPPAEQRRHYVVFEDGALGQITMTGDQEPLLTRGGRLVSQEVYEELRARMRAAHQERVAELLAAEEEARRQQYEELRSVGISDTTARSLSGYTGQAVAEDAPASAQADG